MGNYIYTVPLPVSTNNPSVDQPNMTINNASVNSLIAIDHVGFNLNNGGTHSQVTIVATQSDPSPISSPVGIITTQAPVSNSELFYTNHQANIAITNSALTASSGAGMMPGGLQIRAATTTGNASSSKSISFSPAFPKGCSSVVVCYLGGGSLEGQTCSAGAQSASGFTLYLTGSATGVFYIAVGY